MDKRQKPPTLPKEPARRGKKRTETQEPETKQSEEPKPVAKMTSDGQFVVLKIPVRELPSGSNEYQNSRENPPRQLRGRQLTPRQGCAIASARLGMIEDCVQLTDGRKDFYGGGTVDTPVETKEQVVAKILDMIADAMEEKE